MENSNQKNKPKTMTSDTPSANPAILSRSDGDTITRGPAALAPSGNPVGFYPYNTYIKSNVPAPRKPGETKPEYKAADLSKLKPATVKVREVLIQKPVTGPTAPAPVTGPTAPAPVIGPTAPAPAPAPTSSRPWARK